MLYIVCLRKSCKKSSIAQKKSDRTYLNLLARFNNRGDRSLSLTAANQNTHHQPRLCFRAQADSNPPLQQIAWPYIENCKFETCFIRVNPRQSADICGKKSFVFASPIARIKLFDKILSGILPKPREIC